MELDTVMLNALLMSSLLMGNLTPMAGATRPLVANMVPAVLRWTYGKLTKSLRLSLLILALWKDKKRCEGKDCGPVSVCDKAGCDFGSYRVGVPKFFGPGADYTIDSTKPITVVT